MTDRIIRRVVEGVSLERGLESTRALRKWVMLGLAIGVIAGLGAVLFYTALDWATKLLIGGIAGYYPPKPAGEGTTVVQAIRHRWLIPVVTTLGAPLGGAVMAAEILYLHDLEVEALIPSLIASITGYSIFGAFYGWSPVFGNQISFAFNHPIQLLYYAAGRTRGGDGPRTWLHLPQRHRCAPHQMNTSVANEDVAVTAPGLGKQSGAMRY